jgi:hypothetical protein
MSLRWLGSAALSRGSIEGLEQHEKIEISQNTESHNVCRLMARQRQNR